MEDRTDRKVFAIIRRGKSFAHAFRGIKVLLRTQPNAVLHLVAAAVVIILGVVCSISTTEWLALIIAIAMVIVAEAFNTAMEFDIDLTSPDYHPFARDTKDVAAAAVLVASGAAFVIGCIIFVPKFTLIF